MSADVLRMLRHGTPEALAENFKDLANNGDVKWAVMVMVDHQDNLQFEWTALPSNLAAIGAVEFLKRRLMEE